MESLRTSLIQDKSLLIVLDQVQGITGHKDIWNMGLSIRRVLKRQYEDRLKCVIVFKASSFCIH